MKALALTLILVITGGSFLHAEGCTQEQISRMIKQNLSQDAIDSACKNEAKGYDANKFYVGIGITVDSGTLTYSAPGFPGSEYDYDSTTVPFKVGYIFESDNRFELSYESTDYKFSWGPSAVSGWNMDWNFVYPQDAFSVYWAVGFGSYTGKEIGPSYEDLNGFAVNLGLGLLYAIDDDFELEVAYKNKATVWQDVDYGFAIVSTTTSMSSLYLGANIKF